MTRTVKLEITSDVKGLQNGLRTAQRATNDFARDVKNFGKNNADNFRTIGDSAGKAGLAVLAGFALVGKAAIDWESAFAGVRKTTDATEAQYAQLEDGLRSLAKTLPATHEEIAGVAEAAGQLGVARKDIVGFTKTMIDLGESTNLTAEDAATNIAQISNVMGTMGREGSLGVQRFGSALVALGNDGASTESEILSMAQRIAGASATLGASEADVLALSNTLASMGVNAELGGGVASRVLLRMRTAVDEGGKSLDSFAKVAGVSADEFATKFREAPVEALDLVSQGINGVNESGGNVTATLKEMGIKGTEETQVMLALANSGDLLTDSLNLGAQAWEENTALVAEAEQRYNTTEAKISIAWNKIKDAAITAGGVILPMIGNMADAVGGLADWFGALPDSIQTFLTVLGGVGGAAALGLAGITTMASKLGELSAAMGAIYGTGGRAHSAIKNVGKALTGITVVGAGLIIGKEVIEGINDAVRSGKPAVEDYFNLLATGGGKSLADGLNFDPGTDFTGIKQLETMRTEAEVTKGAIKQLASMNDALLGDWFAKNLTLGDTRKHVDQALELEKALQSVAQAFDMGEADLGVKALSDFAAQMELTDAEVAQMINNVPELKTALTNLATDGGIQIDPNDELGLVDLALGRIATSAPAAADGTGQVADALAGTGEVAAETARSLDDILASIFELGRESRTVSESQDALTSSLTALNESISENGKQFTGNSEAALKNREALRAVATDMESVAEAQARAGASSSEIQSSMQSTYDALMKATGGSEALVRELLGIPKDVKVSTWMSESAKEIAEATANAIEVIPGYTKVGIAVSEDGTVGQVQSRIDSVTGKTEYIFVTDDGTVVNVQSGIANIKGKDVPVYVGDDGTVYSTQGKISGIKGKDVTITATAATGGAESALASVARNRTAYITAAVIGGPAGAALNALATRGGYTGGLVGRLIQGNANGGLVPGQIPLNSQGDNVLAMVNGKPFGLRSGEMVVNEKATRENLPLLQAINGGANIQLPGFASGGVVGRAERRVADLQKQIRRVPGTKANRSRKADLQDRLDDAKAELKAAKAEVAAAKKRTEAENKKAKEAREKAAEAAKAERERIGRVNEKRFDFRRDLKRGEITDSFTSGSGMSVVDQLFGLSKNKDLSKSQRSSARSAAYGMESQLLSLEKRSESLKTKLDKATEARDRLLEVSKSVASGLRGEYSLGNVIGNLLDKDYKGTLNAGSFVKSAQGKARQIRQFGEMLAKLRKKGYNEAIIQEIADLGTAEGTQVGNALLGASSSERKQLNNAYDAMDYWSGKAGVEVTRSMERGGIDAAEGLVRGLEKKNDTVEDAFYKLGKNAEKAFKKSLGIKSPSRVMKAAGINVGEGAELGILSKVGDVQSAAEQLMTPPALMIPPSYEVSRYAQAQAGSGAVRNFTDADIQALASAMSSVQLNARMSVGGRDFATAITSIKRDFTERR